MEGSGVGLGTALPCSGVPPFAGVCADIACVASMEVKAHSGPKGLVKIRISLFCPGVTFDNPFPL